MIDFGKYRVLLQRLQAYLSMFNFAMILYLYASESPLGISWYYWVCALSIFIPIFLFIDIRIVYPLELKYTTKKNPEWNDKWDVVFDKLEEIKGLVDETNE